MGKMYVESFYKSIEDGRNWNIVNNINFKK